MPGTHIDRDAALLERCRRPMARTGQKLAGQVALADGWTPPWFEIQTAVPRRLGVVRNEAIGSRGGRGGAVGCVGHHIADGDALRAGAERGRDRHLLAALREAGRVLLVVHVEALDLVRHRPEVRDLTGADSVLSLAEERRDGDGSQDADDDHDDEELDEGEAGFLVRRWCGSVHGTTSSPFAGSDFLTRLSARMAEGPGPIRSRPLRPPAERSEGQNGQLVDPERLYAAVVAHPDPRRPRPAGWSRRGSTRCCRRPCRACTDTVFPTVTRWSPVPLRRR